MLKPRDIAIINHIEKYGFITIPQCETMFYDKIKDSYTGARKRLQKLAEYDMSVVVDDKQKEKLLKSWTNSATNQKVYSLDGRKASQHSILIMDFYTKFIQYNALIREFSKKIGFIKDSNNQPTIKPDAYIRYTPEEFLKYETTKDKSMITFLEIDCTHEADLTRYIKLYNSGEVQEMLGDITAFPKLIVACENPEKRKIPKELINFGKINIQFIDFKFSNFVERVLT